MSRYRRLSRTRRSMQLISDREDVLRRAQRRMEQDETPNRNARRLTRLCGRSPGKATSSTRVCDQVPLGKKLSAVFAAK